VDAVLYSLILMQISQIQKYLLANQFLHLYRGTSVGSNRTRRWVRCGSKNSGTPVDAVLYSLILMQHSQIQKYLLANQFLHQYKGTSVGSNRTRRWVRCESKASWLGNSVSGFILTCGIFGQVWCLLWYLRPIHFTFTYVRAFRCECECGNIFIAGSHSNMWLGFKFYSSSLPPGFTQRLLYCFWKYDSLSPLHIFLHSGVMVYVADGELAVRGDNVQGMVFNEYERSLWPAGVRPVFSLD